MTKKILKHFRKNDPALYRYAIKVGNLEPIKKDRTGNYFRRLCREIIGQQLSDKSSEAILGRFQKLFPKSKASPRKILLISHDQLRATGMAHAKARYIRNLAEEVTNGHLNFARLDSLTDEEVTEALTKVKGIGRWTAEMFLIFTLGREDVFSFGDLGLKKGLMKVYKLKSEPERGKIEKIIQKWSPYKSFGARIVWKSLEMV